MKNANIHWKGWGRSSGRGAFDAGHARAGRPARRRGGSAGGVRAPGLRARPRAPGTRRGGVRAQPSRERGHRRRGAHRPPGRRRGAPPDPVTAGRPGPVGTHARRPADAGADYRRRDVRAVSDPHITAGGHSRNRLCRTSDACPAIGIIRSLIHGRGPPSLQGKDGPRAGVGKRREQLTRTPGIRNEREVPVRPWPWPPPDAVTLTTRPTQRSGSLRHTARSLQGSYAGCCGGVSSGYRRAAATGRQTRAPRPSVSGECDNPRSFVHGKSRHRRRRAPEPYSPVYARSCMRDTVSAFCDLAQRGAVRRSPRRVAGGFGGTVAPVGQRT